MSRKYCAECGAPHANGRGGLRDACRHAALEAADAEAAEAAQRADETRQRREQVFAAFMDLPEETRMRVLFEVVCDMIGDTPDLPTPEAAHACQGPLELLHVAMGEILSRPDWWDLPENQAAGIGLKAVRGALPAKKIVDEFRTLRLERGLPEVCE